MAGHSWSLWSARAQSGANGLEEGGLVIGGRAYGLCPGFPNPAELELADIGPAGLVYGVIGYPGLAKVDLYQSTAGTFDRGLGLPSPSVTVVRGVSFFIGTLPKSACDYSSLELNSTSPGVSAEHNLGFGHCTAGQLVPITASQGIWQLPPGQFPPGFGGPGGGGAGGGRSGPPGFRAPDSDCYPQTNAATSGGPAATLAAKATEVAHGTVAGHAWSLWSARGQSGANGLEDGGLVVDGRAYGLCPGFPNPAELELADIGPAGLVYGVIGYPGLAQVHLYTSTTGTFDTGQALPPRRSRWCTACRSSSARCPSRPATTAPSNSTRRPSRARPSTTSASAAASPASWSRSPRARAAGRPAGSGGPGHISIWIRTD